MSPKLKCAFVLTQQTIIEQTVKSHVLVTSKRIRSLSSHILGVLVHNKTIIPGSDDAIKKLRALGKTVGFVTNNTLYPVDNLMKILTPFGAKPNEIINPNLSLVQYLKKTNFQKDIYVIGSEALKSLLTDAGHKVIEYKVRMH